MNGNFTAVACLFAFSMASLWLTSCNKASMSISSSSRTDFSVNNQRTITKKINAVTKRLETTTDVKLEKGEVASFPKGAVVKLEESGSSSSRVAELRENGGGLELWVMENGELRRGTAEEEVWMVDFLKDVIGD